PAAPDFNGVGGVLALSGIQESGTLTTEAQAVHRAFKTLRAVSVPSAPSVPPGYLYTRLHSSAFVSGGGGRGAVALPLLRDVLDGALHQAVDDRLEVVGLAEDLLLFVG